MSSGDFFPAVHEVYVRDDFEMQCLRSFLSASFPLPKWENAFDWKLQHKPLVCWTIWAKTMHFNNFLAVWLLNSVTPPIFVGTTVLCGEHAVRKAYCRNAVSSATSTAKTIWLYYSEYTFRAIYLC